MSNAKHTPGPWHFFTRKDADGYKERVIAKDFDNGETCSLAVIHHCREDEANARLIAAAPELLEALELAKMGLEAAIEKCRANNDSNFLGYALTLDKVNLSIAKARGE